MKLITKKCIQMKKSIIFFMFICICLKIDISNLIYAQDEKHNKGFFGSIETRYLKGFSAEGDYISYPSKEWNLYGKSLRFYFGYFINAHFSIGIGFGADRYEKPGANTFPLVIDLRGYLKDCKNTPFIFFDAGNSLKFSEAQEKGFLLDAGLGYKFFVLKRLCLIGSIGYNYKHFPKWYWYSDDPSPNPDPESYKWAFLNRHSLAFSLGIFF